MLAELVPVGRVVGVTYLVDDPEISNVPGRYPAHVPRLRDTGPEQVIALGPDLVCAAPYNTADTLKLLERAGLTVYRNEAYHGLDEVETGIEKLGVRVGEPERARAMVARLRERRRLLAERLRDLPHRPRVLFWSAGFTAGTGTTIDDVIREAGGVGPRRGGWRSNWGWRGPSRSRPNGC
jgi:iron complex transport system substrate-binding protein